MENIINHLKNRIIKKCYILNGSVVEQYKRCGKTTCRCFYDKKYWHGPYWVWTRKENGKTVTRTLNKKQVQLVRNAIKEMKDLDLIIKEWKKLSINEFGIKL